VEVDLEHKKTVLLRTFLVRIVHFILENFLPDEKTGRNNGYGAEAPAEREPDKPETCTEQQTDNAEHRAHALFKDPERQHDDSSYHKNPFIVVYMNTDLLSFDCLSFQYTIQAARVYSDAAAAYRIILRSA
jgi:hypothetical protein